MISNAHLEDDQSNKSIIKLEIEVCLNPDESTFQMDREILKSKISSFLIRYFSTLPLNHLLEKCEFQSDLCLYENVENLQICSLLNASSDIIDQGFISLDEKIEIIFYFYSCIDIDDIDELGGKGKNSEPKLSTRTNLPSPEFQGLWETLVFEQDIKQKLITYVNTALLFGDAGVNPNIISINRVCLLYGPPGTGKTTLAKAIAQKMTIRMGEERYPNGGVLVEINPNAIFSKFFAESSKLLLKMFDELHRLLDDQDCFVALLMDEVESLTAARKSAMNGNEPSDAIRVVNCLLTQIDRLKSRGNVLVIATSNITEAIDIAFLDRADIKQFIGDPSISAIYTILRQAILELMRTKLITPSMTIHSWKSIKSLQEQMDSCNNSQIIDQLQIKVEMDSMERKTLPSPSTSSAACSLNLQKLASQALGLSGRTLTKITFLAYSHYIQNGGHTIKTSSSATNNLDEFIQCMEMVIKEAMSARDDIVMG